MSYYDVLSILGYSQTTGGTKNVKNCIWVVNPQIITVQFMNDMVYAKYFNRNETTKSVLALATTHSIYYIPGCTL